MGIEDEALSLRALRVTDGDVQAACDLIFEGFGWGREREYYEYYLRCEFYPKEHFSCLLAKYEFSSGTLKRV